jgi:hypothetical protein
MPFRHGKTKIRHMGPIRHIGPIEQIRPISLLQPKEFLVVEQQDCRGYPVSSGVALEGRTD